jgi:TRAP-type mannitol/chloroaromatic compound transport system permease small subunit
VNAIAAYVRFADRCNEVVGRAVAWLTLGTVVVCFVVVVLRYVFSVGFRRAWIDLIGTAMFLLPWLAIVLWYGLPFVGLSWRLLEPSSQMGGMPGYFVLKSVIVLFCVLVGAQGLALAGRSVLVICGIAVPSDGDRG